MKKTITYFVALVTLISFVFPFLGNDNITFSIWQIVCLVILVVSLILSIIWDYYSKPKTYKNAEEIKNYMFKWINNPGRTLIFTRDMSWTSDMDIKDLLKHKAKLGNLILCMPKKTNLACELEKDGAEIIEYSKLKYKPKSRFTMIHYGRTDTKMAIGRTGDNEIHYIKEVQSGLHTEYHLAEDLFEILKEIRYNE
jgi:hypothetical protein